jgi:hypothetical protein
VVHVVEIHLYGKLRKLAPENVQEKGLVRVESKRKETLGELIQRIGLRVEQIYHVFYNAKLLATRNTMAPYLEYRQVHSDPHRWELDIELQDGDRIGLFGRDMPALVV